MSERWRRVLCWLGFHTDRELCWSTAAVFGEWWRCPHCGAEWLIHD